MGSLNSIHSTYERLKCVSPLTLIVGQGSSEKLSISEVPTTVTPHPPPPMASASSSSQEASGSSGCTTSDYHQVDGVAFSKEPEQELSTPSIDTLSVSDIIATMEEDTAPTAVEQALHEAYVPDVSCDTLAPLTSSSMSATLAHSNETGCVQPQETKATSSSQPHAHLGVSSLDTFPGDSLSELPLGDWLVPQHMTNSTGIHHSKASEASGYVTEEVAQEQYSNGAQQQCQLENNLLND